ncbi:serine/threonine-protein phosphatase [Elysia marginata]|uniref:Serine/threonine-protein phosphatase n=1 Tax=Elysia marginata TaxID=1093978 RepID=A0AAV4HZL1_9GAST|nr:serine/threonine-protein phosphatase [Elysia marginata]
MAGMIQATQWCQAMETVMEIDVPWRLLRPRLVSSAVHTNGQQVLYESTFHDRRVSFRNMESGPSVTESLYRHKEVLETIFRTFDKDSSGCLSMAEFSEACQILTRHAGLALQPEQISDIAHSLDLNHDGHIDFNEFLEAFRIVESQERKGRAAMLFDIPEREDGDDGGHLGNDKIDLESPDHNKPAGFERNARVSEDVFKHLTPSLSTDSRNRRADSIQVEICSDDLNEEDSDPKRPPSALSSSSWVDVQRARVAQQSDSL